MYIIILQVATFRLQPRAEQNATLQKKKKKKKKKLFICSSAISNPCAAFFWRKVRKNERNKCFNVLFVERLAEVLKVWNLWAFFRNQFPKLLNSYILKFSFSPLEQMEDTAIQAMCKLNRKVLQVWCKVVQQELIFLLQLSGFLKVFQHS